MSVNFYVAGPVQTAGSKTAITNPKTGKAIVVESGDRQRKRSWRADLRAGAEWARPEDWDLAGAMLVVFTIVRRRPATHYRANGQLKDWARTVLPVARPDALKVARAAEDALTGILWHDDSQIVDGRQRKVFGDSGRPEGLNVWCDVMRVRETDD